MIHHWVYEFTSINLDEETHSDLMHSVMENEGASIQYINASSHLYTKFLSIHD